jgi:hypothetical protein
MNLLRTSFLIHLYNSKWLLLKRQEQGLRNLENQGVSIYRDDCFQDEHNAVIDVLKKSLPQFDSRHFLNQYMRISIYSNRSPIIKMVGKLSVTTCQ